MVETTLAFKLGYEAYQKGLKRNDNPYEWYENAQDWLCGWDEAWLDDK